jgi:hypothetical protein
MLFDGRNFVSGVDVMLKGDVVLRVGGFKIGFRQPGAR